MSEPSFMATWRADHYSCKPVIYMHKPAVLLACQVNDADIALSYPLQSIFYDTVTAGSYTNVREGHMLIAGTTPGASDLGRTFVTNISSGIINVPRTSKGTKDGQLRLSDNVYLTVLDLQWLATYAPFISSDTPPITYKRSNIPVGSYGTTFVPVANPGPAVLDYVDPNTSLLTVNFVDYSEATQGTITGWAWDFGTGATPSTSTSQNPGNVTFPPGFRYVYLTVTCDNGLTHTGHTSVMALEKTGVNAPLSVYEVKYTRRLDGCTLKFKSRDNLPASQYVDGTLILAMVQETFIHDRAGTLTNGSDSVVLSSSAFAQVGAKVVGTGIPSGTTVIAVPDGTHVQLSANATITGASTLQFIYQGSLDGPTGRKHMLFTGWHKEDSGRSFFANKGRQHETTFTAVDALGRLQAIRGFPQILQRKALAAKWEEQAGLNIDTYEHYLGYWHCRVMECATVLKSGLGSTYPIVTLGSGGASIYEQMDKRAKAVKARMTIDRFGTIKIRQDPFLLDYADRTSTVQANLVEGDWNLEKGITVARHPEPRTLWARESAVLIGTDDYDTVTKIGTAFCTIPGAAPGWGSSEDEIGEQLAVDANDLLSRAGHRNARGESILGQFDVELIHAGECGIEPGLMQWVQFTMSAANMASRNIVFSAERFWCYQLEYEFDTKHQHRTATISIEKETIGDYATIFIPDEPDAPANTATTLPASPSTLGLNKSNLLPKGYDRIGLVNTDGYIYLTLNFSRPAASGGPTWYRVSAGSISGTIVTFVVDAASPYYINGSGNVNGWIVTTTGIYYVTALAVTPSAALQKSLRGASSKKNIQSSYGALGNLALASAYSDGVYVTHAEDGATWSSETLIGSANEIGSSFPGMFVGNQVTGKLYTSAPTSGSTIDGFGSSDNGVTTPAALSNPDILPGIALAGDINASFANESAIFHGGGDPTSNITYSWPTTGYWTIIHGTLVAGRIQPVLVSGRYVIEVDFQLNSGGSLFDTSAVNWDYCEPSGVKVLEQTYIRAYDASGTYLGSYEEFSPTTYFDTGGCGSLYRPGSISGIKNIRFHRSWGSALVGDIGLYEVYRVITNPPKLMKVVGTTKTDVSPSFGYGTWKGRQIDLSPVDQRYIVCAAGNLSQSLAGIWLNSNAGVGSWRQLVAPKAAGNRYEHSAISGDGKNAIYVFGTNGVIGYSDNLSTVDSRIGNLATFSPGEHVGIFGW